MPVYLLNRTLRFPQPRMATTDGLLAVGGDLRPARLVRAYERGIFPWPAPGMPLLWFSPDPRFLLFPEALRVSRRLAKTLRQARFEVRADTAFREVIDACATVPRGPVPEADAALDVASEAAPEDDANNSASGTWITPAMRHAYIALHRQGVAHSIETYRDGVLVGGLYGVSLGRMFCGESMFHRVSDASKVALVALVRQVARWGFAFVDCQIETPHLARMGGQSVARATFLEQLTLAVTAPTRLGPWPLDPDLLAG